MRDETHEQIIEHRSVFAVDDALVVTTISKTDTPVCGTCWRYVQHDDEQQTTEYVRAAWPCEVARLRERVAAMEHAVRWYAEVGGMDSVELLDDHGALAREVLAQADETGGAR